MKKLISLLGALGMIASTSTTVISCGNNDSEKKQEDGNKQEEGNSVVKITIDEDNISKKSGTSIVKVEMSKELTNTKNLTLTSDKGDSSILKIADGVANSKNNKLYEFKITLKGDLPLEEITEKLVANLNGKATDKSVELLISPRAEFDLELIGEFIGGEGIFANFNPFGNKGYLSIDQGNMSNKDFIKSSVKEYVKNVLNLELVQMIIKLDVQAVLNMVEITYLNESEKESAENEAVASIKIKVKDGHADDIDDYHVVGEANVKLAEKKSLDSMITERSLGTITVSGQNKIEDDIQKVLLEKNTDVFLKNSFVSKDLEIVETNLNNNKGTAKLKINEKFNNIFNEKTTNIEFNFEVNQ